MSKMCKSVVLLSFMLCTSFYAFSQPGGIVSDPGAYARMIDNTAILAKLFNNAEKVEKAAKTLNDIEANYSKVKLLIRLGKVIDRSICIRQNLNVALKLSPAYRGCVVNFQLDVIDLNAGAAVDYIGTIAAVGGGVIMTKGEKQDRLEKAIEYMESSNMQIVELSRTLIANADQVRLGNKNLSQVAKLVSFAGSRPQHAFFAR